MAVYHLTEVPCFVSDKYLAMFDPQACHIPNVNPTNPGKLINFVRHPNLLSEYPDQFSPFRAFGCGFDEPYDVCERPRAAVVATSFEPPHHCSTLVVCHVGAVQGPIFRFALRSEAQAKSSRLSTRAHSVESMRGLLAVGEVQGWWAGWLVVVRRLT